MFDYAALRAVLYFDVMIGIVVGLEDFPGIHGSSPESKVSLVESVIFVVLLLLAVG